MCSVSISKKLIAHLDKANLSTKETADTVYMGDLITTFLEHDEQVGLSPERLELLAKLYNHQRVGN
jgi:hypothetical protein